MFWYNLTSKPEINISEKIINSIFKSIDGKIEKKQKWTINIVFIDDEKIKILNNNYRNIDKTTDVLSFHYFDNFENLEIDDVAWEIILSINKIISQWIEYWLWEEKEFYKLLIHSLLHILWYDHESDNDYNIMNDLEIMIWKEVFEK